MTSQKNRPFELARVRMRAHELAPGTYTVMADDVDEVDHAATNAGFLVGESGVLVIESLSTGTLASQLIGEIRKVTSLPIRFLVNTSFHGDHCFGNFAFPAQTVIIGHEATKRAIDERFEQDRAFMIDLLGAGLGIEDTVARSADLTCTESLTLDLGGRRVEILHLGYAQTDGDLIVHATDANVTFVGNVLKAPPPAFPWLFEGRPREAIATYRRLHERLDDEAAIVPGHGRVMRRADILHSIAYLEELADQTDQAKGRGLTLDQARDAVPMDAYSGYSMYERIHFGVNLPALMSIRD